MNKTLKGTIRPKVVLSGTVSRTVEMIEPVIEPLEITENGEYNVPEGVHGFNPVNVAVPERYEEGFKDGYSHGYEIGYPEGYSASQKTIVLQEKSVTENGEVTADYGFIGLSKVNVDVPERKEEEEETLSVTKNGSYEVIPEENKVFSKVNVEVDVAFEGDIGKPYIDTSKITDFSYFCYKKARLNILEIFDTSNGESFDNMFSSITDSFPPALPKVLDTSKGKTFTSMFANCYNYEELPTINTTNATTLSNLYSQCSKMTNVAILDTSNCEAFDYMFNGCTQLIEIPTINTSKGKKFARMFNGCSKLETISLTTASANFETTTFNGCIALKNITIGEGWNVNIYLHYSNNLTVESLHGMIENLADLTGQTAKTFQIGATNLAKIDAEHLTMLQNKNWNYS